MEVLLRAGDESEEHSDVHTIRRVEQGVSAGNRLEVWLDDPDGPPEVEKEWYAYRDATVIRVTE